MIRWYIAALLFFASVINYVDRQVLSVVGPTIIEEFNLSPSEFANLGLAFQIPYTLMYVGSGFLVDRWGTRKALAIFMVWWSGASMLHGFSRSVLSLGFFRFLLGAGEPGNFMAGFRAISEWFPPKEKGIVNGLLNGGAALGAIIAPPLVAWLTIQYGWRNAFFFTGAAGFVWLAAWLWIYPSQTPATRAATGPREPLGRVLRRRQTWALLLPRFISDPVWWFYLMWLPTYLASQRGFSIAEIGKLAWMPYLAADLGALTGGAWSGWLIRRGGAPVASRAKGMLPFALLMPLSLLVPRVDIVPALAIICTVAFAHMAWKTNLQTVTNDIFPLRIVGSVSGVIAFGSGLGGSVFTWLTGWLVQNVSYDAVFIVMGFLHPVAYLVFRVLLRKEIHEPALSHNP
jgi:ACS family hexuronate transporter-like MFS transporter